MLNFHDLICSPQSRQCEKTRTLLEGEHNDSNIRQENRQVIYHKHQREITDLLEGLTAERREIANV